MRICARWVRTVEEAGTPMGGVASIATWISSRRSTRWASMDVGITRMGVVVVDPDDDTVGEPFTKPFAI